MIKFLIIVSIIALIFVFTGTWIFGFLGWLFNVIGDGCLFLEDWLNIFGFNSGVIN